MAESLESLEERMAELRAAVRQAVRAGDKAAAERARKDLRETEAAWNSALEAEMEGDAAAEPDGAATTVPRPAVKPQRSTAAASIPVREQVHQALTILGAPAAPKLISEVHQAFFAEAIVTTKLASLRRDEERSFAAQGHARPYYICAALTHDHLVAARGLLAVSTWPIEQRIIGPLGPRTNFLTQAIHVAEQVKRVQATGQDPSEAAWRLLRRFALNIPGAHEGHGLPDPDQVIRAAGAEAEVHAPADAAQRRAAAERARGQLSEVQQLFGGPPFNVARRFADEGADSGGR